MTHPIDQSRDVEIKRIGRVTSVVLNRPEKLNALTGLMIAAVRDAIKAAQEDAETRVIILRGEGRSFCAGDDVSDLAGAAAKRQEQALLVATLQDVTRQIMRGPKPVIAAVQGWAVGAAFAWMLNCDLCVCAETATAFFPEVKWGVSPTGAATVLAPSILGAGRTREAFLLSRRWTARELLKMGAITSVVPDGQEVLEAESLANRLVELPAFALCGVKRLTNRSLAGDLEAVLAEEASLALETSSRAEVAQRLAQRKSS